jgi:hypothetical protein
MRCASETRLVCRAHALRPTCLRRVGGCGVRVDAVERSHLPGAGIVPRSHPHLVLIAAPPTYESGPNVARVTTEENGNIVTDITYLKDGRNTMMSHRLNCIPDTIDPRGPKGR